MHLAVPACELRLLWGGGAKNRSSTYRRSSRKSDIRVTSHKNSSCMPAAALMSRLLVPVMCHGGLRDPSRQVTVAFPDYTASELFEILQRMLPPRGLVLR